MCLAASEEQARDPPPDTSILGVWGVREEGVCVCVTLYPTEGGGCRGKVWCHVVAGKPPDMFGLQFKQTKLWQPRNDVS